MIQIFGDISAVLHKNYIPGRSDWDIAVIRLPGELTFNKFVQPVSLPRAPINAGTNCVVTGWGDTLDKLKVSITYMEQLFHFILQISFAVYRAHISNSYHEKDMLFVCLFTVSRPYLIQSRLCYSLRLSPSVVCTVRNVLWRNGAS